MLGFNFFSLYYFPFLSGMHFLRTHIVVQPFHAPVELFPYFPFAKKTQHFSCSCIYGQANPAVERIEVLMLVERATASVIPCY